MNLRILKSTTMTLEDLPAALSPDLDSMVHWLGCVQGKLALCRALTRPLWFATSRWSRCTS